MGTHNGLNTHHQLQSILSNILAKKNAKNTITASGEVHPIVIFLSSMFLKFISPIY